MQSNIEMSRRRFHAGLLAALALVLLATGAMGVFILQGIPHRQVNELVEVLAAGIGGVMAAGGVIWRINHWQAAPDYHAAWLAGIGLVGVRWAMAMLQLLAMAAMILAIYARLLGHPLPQF